jgi:hypothetical protein
MTMAIDDNDGKTATGSWVGKGTGSGATSADDKRQSLGTGGASDHVDASHAGSGSEGGLGSGLAGASDGLSSQTGTQSGGKTLQGQGSSYAEGGDLGGTSGASGAGGLGAETGMRPDQDRDHIPPGTGLGASLETGTSRADDESGMFNDWETSSNPMIASNRVEGTAVYSHDRERLGTIQHIMIDKLSGQSEFAVMSFGGFLGIGSDYYPIPWNKLTYDTEAGGYVVDITREQLSGAPSYSADQEPEYGEDYTGQIGRHYGL